MNQEEKEMIDLNFSTLWNDGEEIESIINMSLNQVVQKRKEEDKYIEVRYIFYDKEGSQTQINTKERFTSTYNKDMELEYLHVLRQNGIGNIQKEMLSVIKTLFKGKETFDIQTVKEREMLLYRLQFLTEIDIYYRKYIEKQNKTLKLEADEIRQQLYRMMELIKIREQINKVEKDQRSIDEYLVKKG